jgi:hypothetical protein
LPSTSNDVERDQALGARIVAVDSEGDAGAMEDQVGFGALAGERPGALRGEPGMEFAIVRADGTGSVRVHFVVERR